ncbi:MULTISPECIES: hypothetical protein [Flavobacterium]|nr:MULTISPECIES: hypothetical protein [Flavobacterium]
MKNKENIRILLTDDDPDDREFFADALTDILLIFRLNFVKTGRSF